MRDKDTSALREMLQYSSLAEESTNRRLQHIEDLSKSKTRVGMVWLKWIVLETIADVLAISTYKHPSPLHASNMLFI